MIEKIEKNYINKGLTNIDGIKNIRRYFPKATEEQNTLWIIKAYTAETDFYKFLNNEIAAGASQYQNERRRTGVHIENSSQYANEGEILIMPYSVFEVKDIRKVQLSFLPDDQFLTEINLEECAQYL
ncbi:unnamed protein product [Rotaria sp. Silwood2]|nr:unnamed protein product [Rotaria sp. Silwood2]CAF4141960.1 unnamed protein product [Rotaria sp. Silwood2]